MSDILLRLKATVSRYLTQLCSHVPQRYVTIALCSLASFFAFFERRTYYQALYDITDSISRSENLILTSKCPEVIQDTVQPRIWYQNYQPWRPNQVYSVRQVFYLGYMISLIPCGIVVDLYGPKKIVAFGVVCSCLMTILFPVFSDIGLLVTTLARLFQGVSQGMIFPGIAGVIANWVPASERSSAVGIVYAPQFFGWSMGYWMHSIYELNNLNWNLQFYVVAALGIIWLVLWLQFVYDGPIDCPHIRGEELQKLNPSNDYDRLMLHGTKFIPWKDLLHSNPMYALVLANWTGDWVHYLMLNYFRFYLSRVVGLPVNLTYDMVEYCHFVIGVSCIFWGFVSDWLINHKYMTRTTNRIAFTVVSNLLVVLCFGGILLAGCSGAAVGSMYMAMCYCRGPFYVTTHANEIDLNPHYAGTVNAILNMTGVTSALLSLNMFKTLCKDRSDVTQWAEVFSVIVVLLLLGSAIYLWLGSCVMQLWGLARLTRVTRISDSSTRTPTQPILIG